jgi:diguanylate cyclase (GGDEF)-like protein
MGSEHSSLPASHSNETAHTFLIIDPDAESRWKLEQFGEQFMVRLRSVASLEEGKRLARTPLLTGVMLSTQAIPERSSLREAVEALRAESPLSPLPVAILDEPEERPDPIRGLWAGASVLLSKPLSAHTFGRAARRLISLCRAQKSTILVVEPEGYFAEYLAHRLNRTTSTVHFENSPDLLFDSLEQTRPDLLVIDAHPGKLSAFDICRTLRAMPRWQDLPIVMVADGGDDQTRLDAFRSGADDFIDRNINGTELQARLKVRLDRARLLKERADYDLLTGLLTRRAFLEQLAIRLSESRRHERNLAFCLLDVDRFKQVNDLYGHLAGDRVLETLGRLLRNCFRIEDLRSRWGGEEFAVVLVDEGINTAHLALQRTLEEFSQIPFHDDSGRQFQVTFSAGIAQFPDDGEDPESLVSVADDRLLRAKRAGRNTVRVGRH